MPSIGRILETKVQHLIDHLLHRPHAEPAATARPADKASPTPAGWGGKSEFVAEPKAPQVSLPAPSGLGQVTGVLADGKPASFVVRDGRLVVDAAPSSSLEISTEARSAPVASREGLNVDDPHFRAALEGPIQLAMSADHREATLRASIPISALRPPMSVEIARQLTAVRLPSPWAFPEQSVRFKVLGEGAAARLEVTADHACPSAFRQLQGMLELEFKSGQFGVLELGSPKLLVDETAFERAQLLASLANQEGAAAWDRRSLEEARAALAHPESIPVQGQDQLDRSRAALAELAPRLAARRDEVRRLMAEAPAQTWALAADFPSAEPGTPAAALGAEADALMALSNSRCQLRDRVANLREVIADIEGSPTLTPSIQEAATRDLKAELAEKAPALEAFQAELATRVAALKQHVVEAGLEDALLARAELFVTDLRSTDADGSLTRLQREVKWESELVGTFEAQVARDGATKLQGMQGWERSLVARLEERGQAITDLKAQLAALDSTPVTREVPTAYLR